MRVVSVGGPLRRQATGAAAARPAEAERSRAHGTAKHAAAHLWGHKRVVRGQDDVDGEFAALVGRADWALDLGLPVHEIGLVEQLY